MACGNEPVSAACEALLDAVGDVMDGRFVQDADVKASRKASTMNFQSAGSSTCIVDIRRRHDAKQGRAALRPPRRPAFRLPPRRRREPWRVGGAAVSERAGRSSRGAADNVGAAGFGEAPAAVPADVENVLKAVIAIAAEQHRHVIFLVGKRATVWQPVGVPDEGGCERRIRRSTSARQSYGLKWLSTAMQFTAAATLPLDRAGHDLSANSLKARSDVGRKVHAGV